MAQKNTKETGEMTTIEVKFTCDDCRKSLLVEVRVSAHLTLGSDNIPEGWTVRPELSVLKCYCPEHAKHH